MEPPVISTIPMVNIIMTGRGRIFDRGLILAGRGTGIEPPFPDEYFNAVVTFVILLQYSL